MNIQLMHRLTENVKDIIDDFNHKLNSVVNNDLLKNIVEEYRQHNIAKNELGFNIFKIVSSIYYKEDFHSEILKALLEIQLILNEFITTLNLLNKNLAIDLKYYADCEIIREDQTNDGRIDISIKSRVENRIIIIESKLNNAPDQPRQIPRYVNFYEQKGFKIDSIVYISIDGRKKPNTKDWYPEELEKIMPKMIFLPAYDLTENDLYSQLTRCNSKIKDFKISSVIIHYSDLIKYLGKSIMNKPIMEAFSKLVKEENNFKMIQAIKDMFLDLPKFRALYIKGKFETSPFPFQTVNIYKEFTTFFDGLRIGKSDFAIDIYCSEELYTVSFFDRNAEFDKNESAIKFLGKMSTDWDQKLDDRRIYKYFKFPYEELEMISFLDNFRQNLAEIVKSNPATNRVGRGGQD
ncbi:MAG: hypothetical protein KDE33_26865 [Bacteroidetes bacterium]|nr:hypothetical protein [Bacteroidota bacterium]